MTKSSKKNFTAAVWIIILLIIFAAFFAWLYVGRLTEAKIKLFKILPFPAATVNGQILPMSEFLFRYDLAKRMLGANAAAQNDAELKKQIYNQIIQEAQIRELSKKYRVSVSSKELDAEYLIRAGQTTNLEGKKDFAELLNSYHLTESDYKNKVIKQQLLADKLRVWHNSQTGLSPQTYKQAQSLAERIQKGENMPMLAAAFSEDSVGKAAGGDLGFVNVSEALPELRETLAGMKTGDLKIISSRFGLHIVRLEETNGNQLHLRQIFLKTSDFQSWQASQTKTFKIYKLINI